jgi:hypothetical protein
MHDTLRHSHEKDDVTHLERISSGSPHNEVEKGQQLAPTVSNGPIVHLYRLCAEFNVDERKVVHDPDMHVISLDRLANSALPVRLRPSAHLPGYRRSG